ncbi:hypothetical protein Skr01_60060 [Sphaerisporangium krabiense]|uniref:2-polyprenyl-6-methoxyphenol hydroxylase-like FAD-dependent oxidoreductase n=1 Tax=Sphaerisporangium krabiense TaxID=763782 RepID=A0A7W8ZBL1_9ACTN|nr:styrene monooxygenase/indole monooxygenase family protein [Sphaerisporangium krabiense]MBB5631038.1 2-polyprenyl-6-methoxyphenol hydroxylase-like FAD-dependent oxidoreductase [Sphaerisporangium krabiense]GII65921.1 hypothetical protein Skr01_60060 [Sphaerisporangium krabiense]
MSGRARDIAIVGAGQLGLHLGIGLLRQGHRVRLITNRTGEQIREGGVLSSQAMLAPSLDLERRLGLELWEGACPPIQGVHLTWVDRSGAEVTRFSAPRARPALSVDQRVKMPEWMDRFTAAGGDLAIEDVDAGGLSALADGHDLVVVAAGKGDISGLFPRDTEATEFDTPQRHLALAYVRGVRPHEVFEGNDFGKADGVGEMFMFPALTVSGPCHIITVEAEPGGPLDVFAPRTAPERVLDQIKEAAAAHFPWLARRIAGAVVTDAGATLAGRFAPTRRRPVAHTASGRAILGGGDVLVLNDPVTGQGANNAARCAQLYLDEIAGRGDAPFDEAWMTRTFERYERLVSASTRWTNQVLRPWPPHVRDLLAGARDRGDLAQAFAEGFGDPASILSWWESPREAARLLGREGDTAGHAVTGGPR